MNKKQIIVTYRSAFGRLLFQEKYKKGGVPMKTNYFTVLIKLFFVLFAESAFKLTSVRNSCYSLHVFRNYKLIHLLSLF